MHMKSCLTKGIPSRKHSSPADPAQARPAHHFPPWEASGQVIPKDCRAKVPHGALTTAPQLAVHRAVESRPKTRTWKVKKYTKKTMH